MDEVSNSLNSGLVKDKNENVPVVSDSHQFTPQLSKNKKIFIICIFAIGIFFTSPVLMPIAICCGSYLLLYRGNIKINLLGLFILLLQIPVLVIFLLHHISAMNLAL